MSAAFVRLSIALAFLATATLSRADETGTRIYQQRAADGSVVLTDRPSSAATTQRTWQLAPADPAAAQRRDAARQDAAEVTRRIGQRLEADDRRMHELALARLRVAETQSLADAEAADSQVVWVAGARRRGPWSWNGADAPKPIDPPFRTGRPPTASIVRGVPMSAAGFPIR